MLYSYDIYLCHYIITINYNNNNVHTTTTTATTTTTTHNDNNHNNKQYYKITMPRCNYTDKAGESRLTVCSSMVPPLCRRPLLYMYIHI